MNRIFILGAGFSYHLSGGRLPLMAQLGDEFKQQHAWVSRHFSEGSIRPANLERVLTQLDLELLDEDGAGKQRILEERICDVKQFLRKRLRLDDIGHFQIEKAKSLCARLFADNDTIITFNYDCLLEHILWKLNFWSPNGGYGQSVRLTSYGSRIEQNSKGITILKPHSSLNFEEVKTDRDIYLQPWISDKLFPNIHANWNEEAQTPSIILPSFVKIFGENRTLMYIWHEAIQKIRNADIVIMIGYSLPKSDAMVRFLLSFISAHEFKARGVEKLRVGILSKGSHASHGLKQIIEVGQFGKDDIESLVLDGADDADYETLCDWSNTVR